MMCELTQCHTQYVEQDPPTTEQGMADWLAQLARHDDVQFLLAHMDDGVIWGRRDASGWVTSNTVADVSPQLRLKTVQEVRVFSATAECLLWREGVGWKARWLVDSAEAHDDDDFTRCHDEQTMLWGDQVERLGDSFTLMSDGAQGLRHAVPIEVPPPPKGKARKEHADQYAVRPLRLHVRHYIAPHEPFARIATSRLTGLSVEGATPHE